MSIPDLLVIAGDLDPHRGGQERSIREVLVALDGLGARVALASPRRPDGVPVAAFHQLDGGEGNRLSRWRSLLASASDASARVAAGRVVSHLPVPCHLYVPRGGLYPEAFARSAASHPSPLRRWTSSSLTARHRKELLQRERDLLAPSTTTTLVALSTYVAEQGRRWYGLADDRVRIIRIGIDVNRVRDATALSRSELGVGSDDIIVLAAAHNPRLKGIHELGRAVRDLGRGDIRLVLAGGPTGPRDDTVIPLGPRDDFPRLLATADLLVHPTFYDPSSRVVLEAMAARLPVVTTRWNGAADVLGTGGRVIDDPRNAPALTAAIEGLLDEDNRAACRESLASKTDDINVVRHAEQLLA